MNSKLSQINRKLFAFKKQSDSSRHDDLSTLVPCEDRRSPSPSPDTSSEPGTKLVPRSPSPSSREPSLDEFARDSPGSNGELLTPSIDIRSPADKAPEKKSDKKKKKNAWYNMLSPSYKSRSDDFKKLFKKLPDTERLLVDYSCALQKDILVHGRMYASQNYLCFHANIFRWETRLMIKWRDVTNMTREKTALIIPNAIQITTESEKHFLTSFSAREKTYMMLFRIWQKVLTDQQPMDSRELWRWVHFSYGEELGLTSDDDDYVAPRSREDDIKVLSNNTTSTDSDTNMDATPVEAAPILGPAVETAHPPPTDSDTAESDPEMEFSCGCPGHPGKELFNTVLPLPVDQVFTLVFTGTKFFKDLLSYRKTYDLLETPWQPCSAAGDKMRRVTYTLTLNLALAKSAQNTETQRLLNHSKLGQVYVVECDIVSSGIPYGDTFTTKTVYCLTRVSSRQCRLRIHGAVIYKKGIWRFIKNLVEKSAMQGMEGCCVDLEEALLKEAARLNQHPSIKRRRKRTKEDSPKNESLSDIPTPSHRVSTSHPLRAREPMYNLDWTVKIILLALVVLLVINLVLVYKLWGAEPLPMTDQSALDQLTTMEFVRLLRHQEQLHRGEAVRWRSTVEEFAKMLKLIESSLANLKGVVNSSTPAGDVFGEHRAPL